MEYLTKHEASPLNKQLIVGVHEVDGRDEYTIGTDGVPAKLWNRIVFHEGSIGEVGITGISIEALLAIVDHRMGVLNAKFPCRENAIAATHIQTALLFLKERTRDRESRGVEGTNQK